MLLEDAEDIWLACVMQAPAYADHSLVTNDHLSSRARSILAEIRKQHTENGWVIIEPDLISKNTPNLRTIPRRFATIDAASTIQAAETQLVNAWGNEQYRQAHIDAAAAVQSKGREYAQTMFMEAMSRISAASSGVHWQTASEVAQSVVASLHRGLAERLKGIDNRKRCGWAGVDRALRYFEPKSCTVVGGRTNDGKSTFTLQMLMGLAIAKTRCAFISLEDPLEMCGSRMFAWLMHEVTAISRMDTRDHTIEDMGLIESIAKSIQRDIDDYLIMTHEIGKSPEQIGYAIQDARRRGAEVIAVDYLQSFSTKDDARMFYGNAAKTLKQAGAEVGAHTIIASQLARPRDKENIDKIRPTKYDLKESGDIENIAENVLLVWRPEKNKPTPLEKAYLILDKLKSGQCGEILVGFDKRTHSFRGEEETPPP